MNCIDAVDGQGLAKKIARFLSGRSLVGWSNLLLFLSPWNWCIPASTASTAASLWCRLPGTQEFNNFWTKLVATSTCEISIRGYYSIYYCYEDSNYHYFLASPNSILIPPWFISNINELLPVNIPHTSVYCSTVPSNVCWLCEIIPKKTVLYILYHGADLSDLTSAWIWAILLSLKVTTRMTSHVYSSFRLQVCLKNTSFTFTCHQCRLI